MKSILLIEILLEPTPETNQHWAMRVKVVCSRKQQEPLIG